MGKVRGQEEILMLDNDAEDIVMGSTGINADFGYEKFWSIYTKYSQKWVK